MQADAGEVWQDAERWSPGWEVCKRRELLLSAQVCLIPLLPLFLSLVRRPRSGSKREEEEEQKQHKKNEDKKREKYGAGREERCGPGPDSSPGLGARHTPLTRGEAGSCLAVSGQVGEDEKLEVRTVLAAVAPRPK